MLLPRPLCTADPFRLPAFFVPIPILLALSVVLGSVALPLAHAQPSIDDASAPQAIAFEGGRWFDGTQFTERTLYVADGVFTADAPATVDTTISLDGRYVVPPFAEAHTHRVDQKSVIEEANRAYLEDGVFYVANLNNLPSFADPLREILSEPATIDAAFAHGGFTGPGDHPQPLYENLIRRGVYDGWTQGDLPGEAFHAVTNREELKASFETIMEDDPDLIKAYLMFAETSNPRGLTPALLAELIEMADAAGKRVTVHAQSATDVRLAAEAGADQIAHMPPMPFRSGNGDRYRISEETAQLLAGQNVSVVTTTVLANRLNDSEQKNLVRSIQRENLTTLRAAGVTLAVGSDTWSSGQNEALYLHELSVFDNRALLRMWTGTSRVIFPDRKIGRLAPGYEASLLALTCNPLDDFTCVDKIDLRIKQGTVINRSPSTANSR